MQSGKASIAVVVRMPDGTAYLAQTSLSLLRTAVKAFDAAEVREGSRN
jgi:hypothetical protein